MRAATSTLQARDAATGAVLADTLSSAHTHWTRLKGLLGTASLQPGKGLWIRPSKQVHMFGMRYAVDLVFLDDDMRVVHTVSGQQPNTISPKINTAVSVIELPAGTLSRVGVAAGAALDIQGDTKTQTASTRGLEALICNVALAALYALFATVHIAHARQTGQWATTLPIVIQEALLMLLFLTRRRSLGTSARPLDWAVGIVGTFLPLLLRADTEMGRFDWLAAPLQVGGLGLAIIATTALGRSIGVVAGNRGVRTGGLYRLVRHPMYVGYLLSYAGYVAAYPTARNIVIIVLTVAALIARAIVEERFLASDPSYREYLRRTRWRFVPYVY